MISAFLLAFSGLVVPAPAPEATYASSTIAHMKGHSTLPTIKHKGRSKVSAACHPDPAKSRGCRHRQIMTEAISSNTISVKIDLVPPMESAE